MNRKTSRLLEWTHSDPFTRLSPIDSCTLQAAQAKSIRGLMWVDAARAAIGSGDYNALRRQLHSLGCAANAAGRIHGQTLEEVGDALTAIHLRHAGASTSIIRINATDVAPY